MIKVAPVVGQISDLAGVFGQIGKHVAAIQYPCLVRACGLIKFLGGCTQFRTSKLIPATTSAVWILVTIVKVPVTIIAACKGQVKENAQSARAFRP